MENRLVYKFGESPEAASENMPSSEIGREGIAKKTAEELALTTPDVLTEEMKKLEQQLEKEKKKLEKLIKIADVGDLVDAVKYNDKWGTGQEAEDLVDSAVFQVARSQESIRIVEGKITEIEKKILETKQKIYQELYDRVKSQGTDADGILLTAFDDLGNEVPASLKSEVEAARKRKIENPDSSEFDKSFYAGRYREALDSLGKSNRSMNLFVSPNGANYSDMEIYQLYDEKIGTAKNKNPLTGSMEDLITERIVKAGDFGARKIAEGYVVLNVANKEAYDKKNPLDAAEAVLARKNEDGSLSVYFVDTNGRSLKEFGSRAARPRERIILKSAAEITSQDAENIEQNFEKVRSKLPSFRKVEEAGKVIRAEFIPLQKLFIAGSQGKKTTDFANLAKNYAIKIQKSNALSILRAGIPEIKRDLSVLKSLPSGYRNKFETQISQMEKSLSKLTELAEYGGVIDHFCEQVLNPAFSEDDFWSWAIKEVIVIMTAITTAVTFIVLTVSTGGVGGLALGALVGTATGIVGAEVGYVLSEMAGEARYGKGFSNRSALGKYLAKERMIDPSTGKLKEIDGIDLVKVYGQQFFIGFLSTFVFMGLGQLAGKALSRFATNYSKMKGLKGDFASLINKIPRLKAQHIDLLSKGGMKKMMDRLMREYLQEFGEEAVENVAERISPVTGFIASLYHCLTPGQVKYMLGKIPVAAESFVADESGAVSTYSFDANQADSLTAKVEAGFKKQGFKVTKNPDGSVKCEREIILKDRTKITATTLFNPVNDSVAMRDLVDTGSRPDGKSELADLYGVRRVADNRYEFDRLSPGGKVVDLKTYLIRQGFTIIENQDGTFKAKKKKEVVEFKQNKRAENGAVVPDAPTRSRRVSDGIAAALLAASLGAGMVAEKNDTHGTDLKDSIVDTRGEAEIRAIMEKECPDPEKMLREKEPELYALVLETNPEILKAGILESAWELAKLLHGILGTEGTIILIVLMRLFGVGRVLKTGWSLGGRLLGMRVEVEKGVTIPPNSIPTLDAILVEMGLKPDVVRNDLGASNADLNKQYGFLSGVMGVMRFEDPNIGIEVFKLLVKNYYFDLRIKQISQILESGSAGANQAALETELASLNKQNRAVVQQLATNNVDILAVTRGREAGLVRRSRLNPSVVAIPRIYDINDPLRAIKVLEVKTDLWRSRYNEAKALVDAGPLPANATPLRTQGYQAAQAFTALYEGLEQELSDLREDQGRVARARALVKEGLPKEPRRRAAAKALLAVAGIYALSGLGQGVEAVNEIFEGPKVEKPSSVEAEKKSDEEAKQSAKKKKYKEEQKAIKRARGRSGSGDAQKVEKDVEPTEKPVDARPPEVVPPPTTESREAAQKPPTSFDQNGNTSSEWDGRL